MNGRTRTATEMEDSISMLCVCVDAVCVRLCMLCFFPRFRVFKLFRCHFFSGNKNISTHMNHVRPKLYSNLNITPTGEKEAKHIFYELQRLPGMRAVQPFTFHPRIYKTQPTVTIQKPAPTSCTINIIITTRWNMFFSRST